MMKIWCQTATALAFLAGMLLASPVWSAAIEADPMNSPSWESMHRRYLAGENYVFDADIKVFAPSYAEDSMNVPVAFDASSIEDVQQIVVFADLNPLPLVLRFEPIDVQARLEFHIKLQQGSPIRVAALDTEGLWHVGSTWVNAAGGGCTAPSVGMASGNWTETFGDVSGAVFERSEGHRLKLRIMHPMDTGLAEGIPRFHLEELKLRSTTTDSLIARLELFEPVSENPLVSFDVGEHREFRIEGTDNNANSVAANIR